MSQRQRKRFCLAAAIITVGVWAIWLRWPVAPHGWGKPILDVFFSGIGIVLGVLAVWWSVEVTTFAIWYPSLWQICHPRKAWWMWRVGRKLAAAYEMRQATDDREAEAKRQRETHRRERLAIEATAHQQYGDAVSVFDCPVCGAFIVDPPTVFQPGELCKPIEAPLSYLHVRSHGCTCPPGISGLCPYCSAGARFGWIAYNFDTEEGEGHVGTD